MKDDPEAILSLVAHFAKQRGRVAVSVLGVYLMVYRLGTVSQARVQNRLGLSQTAASRCVKILGTRRLGMGLIAVEKDPENWRENVLVLTDKGKKLGQSLQL